MRAAACLTIFAIALAPVPRVRAQEQEELLVEGSLPEGGPGILRYSGLALVGAGAIALVTGALFGRQSAEARAEARRDSTSQIEALELNQRSNTLAGRANLMFGLGAGTMLGGGLLVALELARLPPPPPSFALVGTVVEQGTSSPIPGATVTIASEPPRVVDTDESGRFLFAALPAESGLVRVAATAPGFRSAEAVVSRGAAGDTRTVELELLRADTSELGTIAGSIRDARTGRPLRGTLLFPAKGTSTRTDRGGRFNAIVGPGRYEVVIYARNHVTQRKDVLVRAGETVLLNVDLSRD